MKKTILSMIGLLLISGCPSDKPSGPQPNDSQFISQKVPANMVPGRKYQVLISMKNTGTQPWTKDGGYKLGAVGDNRTWGATRVSVPKPIPPGEIHTFNFNVVAPTEAGSFEMPWQMLQEGVQWFGNKSTFTVAVKYEEKWKKIVADSGQATNDLAPHRGKIIGDVWSQWLGAPNSIGKMNRYLNLTEMGFMTGHFNEFFEGKKTIEQILRTKGNALGAKNNYFDMLMVAKSIGQRVQVNIDSSCNEGAGGYHNCQNGSLAHAPLTKSGHMGNMKKLYRELLGYLKANFKNTVTHIQIENEPCYQSFTGPQYANLVRQVIPIIDSSFPGLKIMVGDASRIFGSGGHGGICGDAAGNINGVDIIGFHYALPKTHWSNDFLYNEVKTTTQTLKARYPGKEIWCDECGVGSNKSMYTAHGEERLRKMMQAVFDGGGTGFMYLITGGLDISPVVWEGHVLEMNLFSKNKGESQSAGMIRRMSQQYGVKW